MISKELATKLNEHLPEPLFQELTRFLDEGDCSALYQEMAEIDVVRHPEQYALVDVEELVHINIS